MSANSYIASGSQIRPEAIDNAKVARGCCSHIGSVGCSDGLAEHDGSGIEQRSAGFGGLGWRTSSSGTVVEGCALGW